MGSFLLHIFPSCHPHIHVSAASPTFKKPAYLSMSTWLSLKHTHTFSFSLILHLYSSSLFHQIHVVFVLRCSIYTYIIPSPVQSLPSIRSIRYSKATSSICNTTRITTAENTTSKAFLFLWSTKFFYTVRSARIFGHSTSSSLIIDILHLFCFTLWTDVPLIYSTLNISALTWGRVARLYNNLHRFFDDCDKPLFALWCCIEATQQP